MPKQRLRRTFGLKMVTYVLQRHALNACGIRFSFHDRNHWRHFPVQRGFAAISEDIHTGNNLQTNSDLTAFLKLSVVPFAPLHASPFILSGQALPTRHCPAYLLHWRQGFTSPFASPGQSVRDNFHVAAGPKGFLLSASALFNRLTSLPALSSGLIQVHSN